MVISPGTSDSVHPRADRYPNLSEWLSTVVFSPLMVDVQPGWSRFNPSLARLADGSMCGVIRSSNYRLEDGRYVFADVDGAIRTVNCLVGVGGLGVVTNPRPIVAPRGRTVSSFPVHGYEDVRLAPVGDVLWALATVRDADESGLCRVALLRVADDGRVIAERLIEGPAPGRHEKNWVPFPRENPAGHVSTGELTVVYSWDPLVVAAIGLDPKIAASSRYREVFRSHSGLGPNVRGGTNGVRVDGGWLFLVHESRRFPDGRARYLHRVVTVRDDFTLGLVSPQLTLMTDGVEFALGAAIVGDELLIAFGLDDAEAWTARTNLAALIDRLSVHTPEGSRHV